MNDGLRYKLRMMGVPIEGPTHVYCDNEVVVRHVNVVLKEPYELDMNPRIRIWLIPVPKS